jgi:UDP-N-acetylglucosamine 2-epimerase (non-hydrolysing)
MERPFRDKRIIGVTSHRRENFGDGMEAIASAIRRLAAPEDVAPIFPVHLNPNVWKVMDRRLAGLDNVALVEPLDYLHFVQPLEISALMPTDSGGVQEEASAFSKPVLVMRETTERPEGVAAGTSRLVGANPDRVVAKAERLLDDEDAYAAMARAHNRFGDGRSATRIAKLLA